MSANRKGGELFIVDNSDEAYEGIKISSRLDGDCQRVRHRHWLF